MIIYSSNALAFRESVDNNQITVQIEEAFIKGMGKRPNQGEVRAWNNSYCPECFISDGYGRDLDSATSKKQD